MSRVSRDNKRDIKRQLSVLEDADDRDYDNMMNQTFPNYAEN